MQDGKRIQKRHPYIWTKRAVGILICAALCTVIASAQKSENKNQQARTWADLGVTPAHQTQLEVLWELKRQKEIQAVKDLKTLNRFAKDSLVEDTEIQETLDAFRAKRTEAQKQIEKIEAELLRTLPTQAQLHLTLLGILDNGVPRRITKPQTSKKTETTPPQGK
ncbi:hypothetical protein C6503_05390 [Candidatus Poribacteria bacterium]|nr:MAG: hypothetical protein C6503_05390 [Candidatus Poribacteria bacterium]